MPDSASARGHNVERSLGWGAVGRVGLHENRHARDPDGDPSGVRLLDRRPGLDRGERRDRDAVAYVLRELDAVLVGRADVRRADGVAGGDGAPGGHRRAAVAAFSLPAASRSHTFSVQSPGDGTWSFRSALMPVPACEPTTQLEEPGRVVGRSWYTAAVIGAAFWAGLIQRTSNALSGLHSPR
jgi:hypothetical protein